MQNRSPKHLWQGFSGVKSGRAIGHSHEALQANRYLDSVVTRINTIYYRLCEQSEAVTAQMVCKAEK